ncbi:hypothetical protein GCM10011512_28940 [Tersicoccus solisilvae]|uniref:Lipoprotein n=1 Tax=Tersicoccus solisilvae TaxID=1882339 RepID=A0ABQ1PNH5_9MICC|nr:hypothetical protein [Tersicoccus solisilvae]GGD00309.1 hypothetical protein GCM10011512_28940 [Tersicoccus solisilvae]
MRTAASTRVRQAGVVLVASLSVLAATGCQAVNQQATQMSYDASDGVSASAGDVQARNLFVAAAAEGSPARLGGAFFNDADRESTVSLRGASGTQVQVKVPASGEYYLQQEPAVNIGEVDQRPGSMVELTMTESVSGTSTTVRVPVVDGTLSEYRTLVPGTPSPTGTASATPTATSSETASHG